VWIDVDQDAARVKAKYGVRFTPSVVFVDREGALIGEYEGKWETEPLAAKIAEVGARFRGPWARSPEAALERAKAARRVAVVVTWSDASEKPQARVNAALGDTAAEVVLCLRPFDDEAKKTVDSDRTWLVLDPLAEKPWESPLAVIAVPKDAKGEDVRGALRKAREEFGKRHPKQP